MSVHSRGTRTVIVDVGQPADDTDDRLAIVGADGSPPRVLAEDARIPVWFIPGRDRYAVDL